jgi:hypothetical protein
MKRRTRIDKALCGIFFFAAAAFIVLPSSVQARDGYSVWRDRRAEFDAFMRKHPKASTELRQNPELAYNRKWLNKHPEVHHFLKGRPELREAIAYRPGLIYRSHDRYGGSYDRRPYDRFERRDRRRGWQHR